MRLTRLAALLCAGFVASTAAAVDPASAPQRLPGDAMLVHQGATTKEYHVEQYLLSTASDVNASDAVDEMLDEVAADIARLGVVQVSPILIDRIKVSANIAPSFADLLEARLVEAVTRASSVQVSRCLECHSTRGRVENGMWVVTRGVTQLDELRQLAARYSAKTILSATLTLEDQAKGLALDVQLIRPENASVVYNEGYRFKADTAMLYRGADTAQSREAKLKDLEDRLNARPHYGYSLLPGVLYVPVTHLDGTKELVRGIQGGFRLYEKFGDEREYRAGFTIGGFLNDTQLAGAMFSGSMGRRLTDESGYRPAVYLDGSLGAFVTGTAGNSSYAAIGAEALFVHRIGFQLNLTYLLPFDMKKVGKVGGFSPGGGVVLSW